VVIGADAAGMSAASHVVRAGVDVEVVVIERGPYTSYSMCGIPYLIGGEIDDVDDLIAKTPEAFRAMGIAVHLRTEAIAIDPAARTVRVRDLDALDAGGAGGAERDVPYDALLVATGAHPRVPDVVGVGEHGHVVHTLDEGERVRDLLRPAADDDPPSRVVVLGAGYIGMEIAEALVRRGHHAVLVDRSRQVMRTLDDDMAAVVEEVLVGFGVEVHLQTSVAGVRTDAGKLVAVVTDRGEIPADVLIVAAGSRPNVDMAAAAGCTVGSSGALVVDPRMRTDVEAIWAAGDCVESLDLVAGLRRNVQLGTHANKQGRVAGIDILAALDGGSGEAQFPGVVGTAVTKVCEWEIGRVGLTLADAQEAGIAHAVVRFTGTARAGYMPQAGIVHVKMMAERGTGRVLGAQLVGTGNVAKRIDVAAVWCQLGVRVTDAQLLDLSYAPPFGGVWDLLQVAARKLARELGLTPQL
jgi:NADPH-dependent 2,4-dienoyl-CoA reductase/sulfur reductase-like enzyme